MHEVGLTVIHDPHSEVEVIKDDLYKDCIIANTLDFHSGGQNTYIQHLMHHYLGLVILHMSVTYNYREKRNAC